METKFNWSEVHHIGRFVNGLGLVYLFGDNRQELGYLVGEQVFTHTRNRVWSQESINKLEFLTKHEAKMRNLIPADV